VVEDSTGSLYVSDQNNCLLRKITPSGQVTTLGGIHGTYASTDGVGTTASLNKPMGLALSATGVLYV
jgi:hypothetical protein